MKPIIKALATASLCAILFSPLQAGAQQITLSMSGVVDQGRDDLNLFFGSPGEVVFLGGQAYTMSLTVDAADLDSIHSTARFADYSGSSVALTGALTMNGKTLTWTTEAAFSAVYLELAPELYSPGDRQALSMRTTASREPGTGDRTIVARHEAATFFWPLLASTDLNQEISFPEFMRNAVAASHFEATGMGMVPDLTTWFAGRATSATWTVSAVPEPGQVGMLAAGLLALALSRRRLIREERGEARERRNSMGSHGGERLRQERNRHAPGAGAGRSLHRGGPLSSARERGQDVGRDPVGR